jgi:peptidyl-prolyl cis-trans isomerase A (cyclophilin A)
LLLIFLAATSGFGQANKVALTKPSALNERAPNVYKAKFETTAGIFIIEVHAEWAPKGADRFYNLVKNGYYDGCRFFRVMPGFMVQFGINGDPGIQRNWEHATIPDEKVTQGNTRGFVSFAKSTLPNTRTTQVFINFGDNSRLNRDGFAPFGKVLLGMEVVDKIYSGDGQKPDQTRIQTEGNAYLTKNFPKLDYIKKATIEK